MPSALPCSTTLVSPPTICDASLLGGSCHGANLSLEHLGRQPGFQHEADDDGFGLRAGNRQIIHRAVDGKLANRASGKAQRLHHEAVGGHGEANASDVDRGSIVQAQVWRDRNSRGANRPSTRRRLAMPPAPWAISICGSRNLTFGGALSLTTARLQAGHARLVAIALRCS